MSAPTLDAALILACELASLMGADEIIIAGGGEIYHQSLHLAHRLYITEVDSAPDGDVRFPAIDPAQWREVTREKIARAERDEVDSVFVEYVRRK